MINKNAKPKIQTSLAYLYIHIYTYIYIYIYIYIYTKLTRMCGSSGEVGTNLLAIFSFGGLQRERLVFAV